MSKKNLHNCVRVSLFWYKIKKSEKGNLIHEFERFTSKKEAFEIMRKRNVKISKTHFSTGLRKNGLFTFSDVDAGICGIFRLDDGRPFRELFAKEIQQLKPEGENHPPEADKSQEKIVLQKVEPVKAAPEVRKEYPKEYVVVPYLSLGGAGRTIFSRAVKSLLKVLRSHPDSDFKDMTEESLYDHIETHKYLWLKGCFITTMERANSMVAHCRKKELYLTPLGLSSLCQALLPRYAEKDSEVFYVDT